MNIMKILNEKLNNTNTYKTVTNKDMLGAVKGLLMISHTYDMIQMLICTGMENWK